MRPVALVLVAGLALSPLLLGTPRRAASPTEEAGIVVAGTVLSAANTRTKQDRIPDRWRIDLDGDGVEDLTLHDREHLGSPLSELVEEGVRVEVSLLKVERERKTYELVRWLRIGAR
ncbi:MAG: hypothetical protein ACF8XB_14920 [Planctomycetota bacterium JB042]